MQRQERQSSRKRKENAGGAKRAKHSHGREKKFNSTGRSEATAGEQRHERYMVVGSQKDEGDVHSNDKYGRDIKVETKRARDGDGYCVVSPEVVICMPVHIHVPAHASPCTHVP